MLFSQALQSFFLSAAGENYDSWFLFAFGKPAFDNPAFGKL